MDGQKLFFKSAIHKRKSQVYIWYIVVTWAYEVTEILTERSTKEASLLCEHYSDLTSPTSNHLPDISNTCLFLLYIHLRLPRLLCVRSLGSH